MNEPLGDRAVLCVSQFTLYGDVSKGNRPSYSARRGPRMRSRCTSVLRAIEAERGVFGRHMAIELVADGPVTLMLEA